MSEIKYAATTIQKWFRFSLEDLQTAKLVYAADQTKLKQIGYLSQQSIEKSLKAYICFLGLKNRNTHNLADLSRMILEKEADLKNLLEQTVPFTIFVAFRYPDAFDQEPDLEFVESALKCAELVFKTLSAKVPFKGFIE